ncbi:uncharacterized protein [Diabrotica undecimpunctata]|uniref:uncharacterized protein n=1 Tax=Diabrotica undecimpunctata TaxID=50387 RepID=UPI003B632425
MSSQNSGYSSSSDMVVIDDSSENDYDAALDRILAKFEDGAKNEPYYLLEAAFPVECFNGKVGRSPVRHFSPAIILCQPNMNAINSNKDKEEIVSRRRRYLRIIRDYRASKRKIYYLDETWINAGHTVSKIWHDTTVKSPRQAFIEGLSTGLRAPSGKGQRLIVAHIGSDTRFLQNSALVFVSKKTGDYHEDMDAACFEKWFENVLQNIEPNAVVVLDNASYHSRLVQRIPTMSDRKAVLQNWLREKSIPYGEDMVKMELKTIIRQHRGTYRQHVIDTMARLHGITVLRLPSYHFELNPFGHK